ncbi:MAG: glycosyltransferase [Thermodesulfobacteriota bacterium]
MPDFSVVVPAFNSEKTLGRCLGALFNQSCPKKRYEVIVVDDGSTDGSAEAAKSFPVRYFFQKNAGPASARNLGAREAKGAVILFTDADCVAGRDWIKEMTEPFRAGPEVTAVKGAYRTEQKSLVARFAQLEFEERFELLKKTPSIDMVDTYSAAYRREVFLETGGFDTNFPVANNEDTELSYRLSKAGHKMVFNPRAVVCHLNHPDSLRRYARLKFWRGYWRMAVYRRFPDKMVKDHYTPQTLKLEILSIYLLTAGLFSLVPFPRTGIVITAVSMLSFLFLALPFTASAIKKDPTVAVFTPALLFLRASSIGAGALWGAVRAKIT